MARRIMVELIGVDKTSGAFKKSAGEAALWNSEMVRAGRGAFAATVGFGGLGRAVAFASGSFIAFASAATIIKDSVAAVTAFNDTMQKTVGLAGVAQSAVADLSEELLQLGPKVGQTPQALAEGLYQITSAGIDSAHAVDILTTAAKGASAGMGDTKTVASALTSAINAYGEANLSAAHAGDVLAETIKLGTGEADAFAPSIGNVAALAAQMGISFDDVGAALASMTRLGTDAQTASIQLQQIFASLLKTTPQAKAAFDSVGLSVDELKKIFRDQGMLVGLQRLKDAFAGNTEALSKAFPNMRAFRGVIALVGKQSLGVKQAFLDMASAAGTLDSAFSAVTEDQAFKFAQLKANVQAVEIRIGSALAPAVESVTDRLNKFFSDTDNQKQIVDTFTSAVDLLSTAFKVAEAVIYPFQKALGGMGNTLKTFVGLFVAFKAAGWIQGAIAKLDAAIAGIGGSAAAAGTTVMSTSKEMVLAWDNVAAAATAAAAAEGRAGAAGAGAAAGAAGGAAGARGAGARGVGAAEAAAGGAVAGAAASNWTRFRDFFSRLFKGTPRAAGEPTPRITGPGSLLKLGGLSGIAGSLFATSPNQGKSRIRNGYWEFSMDGKTWSRGPKAPAVPQTRFGPSGPPDLFKMGTVPFLGPEGKRPSWWSKVFGDVTQPPRMGPTPPVSPFAKLKPLVPLKEYKLPGWAQLQQAQASLTRGMGDDVKVAHKIVASIKKLVKEGALTAPAMVQALEAQAAAQQTIWQWEDEQKRKAQSFTIPPSLQIAQAKLDAEGKDTTRVLEQIKTFAQKRLASGKLDTQGILDAYSAIGNANQVLRTFQIPPEITLLQAKLEAEGKSTVPALKQALAAAWKAVHSGKYAGAELAAAYNAITAANQALAQAKPVIPPELELASTKASALGQNLVPILLKMRAAARRAIKASGDNIEAQIAAWAALGDVNSRLKQIADDAKAKAQAFAVPDTLRLAMARAQALGEDLKPILERTRDAAKGALRSGKLGLEGQIDAWNEIASVNDQIAGLASDASKATPNMPRFAPPAFIAEGAHPWGRLPGSTTALPTAAISPRAAYASRTGPMVTPSTYTINGGLNVYGVQNVRELEQELGKRTQQRPQTRRGRF